MDEKLDRLGYSLEVVENLSDEMLSDLLALKRQHLADMETVRAAVARLEAEQARRLTL